MGISIFLSYSSADKDFAGILARELSLCGVKVWIDEVDLRIGDSLVEKISKAIAAIDYVIAIVSRTSVNSSWVQKELKLAMTREIETNRTIVLPVRIDQCEIPEFLRDKLYADFTSSAHFHDSLRRLLTAMGIAPPPNRLASRRRRARAPYKWVCVDDGENFKFLPFEKDRYVDFCKTYPYVGLGQTEVEAFEDAHAHAPHHRRQR